MIIKIYSKDGCMWCTKAKELLTKKNITFEEINLSKVTPEEYAIEKNKLFENTGQKTFPYIFIDDKFVGGFNELVNNTAQMASDPSGNNRRSICREAPNYAENYVDF